MMSSVVKQYTFVLMVCVFSIEASYAKTIRCEDGQGKTVFTNKPHLCANYQTEKRKPKKQELVRASKPTQTSATKKKVSYRVPKRRYIKQDSQWSIFIEESLQKKDFELSVKAADKLEKYLKIVFKKLPKHTHEKLKNVKFYLMHGEKSPNGGRKKGMSYIRKGEPKNYDYLDPRWENVIVIYSAKNLMYLNDLWSKKALVHELAHAWHLLNFPDNHVPIIQAFNKAKKKGLYQKVKTVKGEIKNKAYAIKNHREYFAELSAMYFVGADYYPFSRKRLKRYDLFEYQAIEKL